MFTVITRIFEKGPLTAELKPGHLYIGIYLRSGSEKDGDNKRFHVLLATVNPEDPHMIKKYHAINPIDPNTKEEVWKYQIKDQIIPSAGLVALVQICE